jgi:hypothetical protein
MTPEEPRGDGKMWMLLNKYKAIKDCDEEATKRELAAQMSKTYREGL